MRRERHVRRGVAEIELVDDKVEDRVPHEVKHEVDDAEVLELGREELLAAVLLDRAALEVPRDREESGHRERAAREHEPLVVHGRV